MKMSDILASSRSVTDTQATRNWAKTEWDLKDFRGFLSSADVPALSLTVGSWDTDLLTLSDL